MFIIYSLFILCLIVYYYQEYKSSSEVKFTTTIALIGLLTQRFVYVIMMPITFVAIYKSMDHISGNQDRI